MSVVDAEESAISPRADVVPKEQVLASAIGRLRDREAFVWMAMVALVLLLVEWFSFHRRKTV